MKVNIWGSRGSLPASYRADHIFEKVKKAVSYAIESKVSSLDNLDDFIESLPFSVKGSYGANTSCVSIGNDSKEFIICDCGTGIRDLALSLEKMHDYSEAGYHFHILLSHLHWDHIQGFPFFSPAYLKGNKITFYSGHSNAKEVLELQQSEPTFPVKFDHLGADIDFIDIKDDDEFELNGITVKVKKQYHPGDSFGFRFESKGKSFVYSTDCEHKAETALQDISFVKFIKNTDLLIIDAQYSFDEASTVKEDWGHSSNQIAVDLAGLAGVKTLCLFHQEPSHDDFELDQVLLDTYEYAEKKDCKPNKIIMAYDGLSIEL